MLLLQGGLVIDPTSATPERKADVLVVEGRVTDIGPSLRVPEGAEVRDVEGCWVTPGLTDLRAHLREPGQEYKEDLDSGLAAAAAGGFTSVCAMPGTHPPNDNRAVTELILAQAERLRASSRGGARVLPFGAITVGLEGRQLTEMAELREAGVVGVTDDRHSVSDPSLLRRAMEYAKTFGLVVMQHCEELALAPRAQMHEGVVATRLGLRGGPREAEDIAVCRDLRVAALTGAALHIAHVSSAGAVEQIRRAKAQGVRVSADVTAHHLTYTDEAVGRYDTHAKVLPPLREAADRDALREGLADGTIDCIATDHAPHTALEKDCEFDAAEFGMSSLELALPLVFQLVRDGALSRLRAIAALSTAPAAIVGRSAALSGSRDLSVLDPERRWTVSPSALRSKSHNTPLLHQEVMGAARLTMVDGTVVFEREVEEKRR